MGIKNYNTFIKESDKYSQTVSLDNKRGGNKFTTKKYGKGSLAALNKEIANFITKEYSKYGYNINNNFDSDININGMILNSSYITKMINNYTIFKTMIDLNDLKSEAEFYKFMYNNLHEIYGLNGKFFKESLAILVNTNRRGNKGEKDSKVKFTEYAESKGMKIEIIEPTLEEDIKGIDFKFKANGRIFTVQVKPFLKYGYKEDNIEILSNGSLSLDTNYLILFRKDNFIILRNPKDNEIKISGDRFITTNSNVLSVI